MIPRRLPDPTRLPSLHQPKGSEGSLLVTQVQLTRLRKVIQELHRENRELRRECERMTNEREVA